MIPNMKFYVISIVAIFAALGIGIYIGFTLDAQSFVEDQGEIVALELEKRFDYQQEENKKLKEEITKLENNNKINNEFINNSYKPLIKGKLEEKNILIIETNPDYMYSGIGKTLEDANANIAGVVTIKKEIKDIEKLEKFYSFNQIEPEIKDLVQDLTIKMTNSFLEKDYSFINLLINEEIIDFIGNINNEISIDTIVLAGGSFEDDNYINKIDKNIIDIANNNDIGILGVEKTNVDFSYMNAYRDYNISTVDNIDSIIGRISMVYLIKGESGNYGLKNSSESLMPSLDIENDMNFEKNEDSEN